MPPEPPVTGPRDPGAGLARLLRLRRAVRQALSRMLDRFKGGEHTFTIIVAMAVGALAGYGAIGFRWLIAGAHELFFATSEYSLELLHAMPWWHRLLLPCAGGLAVGLIVTRLAPEVRGSGIPEVMEAVARRGGSIRLRVLLTKAVAAALTIGSGGSAGREGPIVHIGSAIGSAVGQALEVSARRVRTFVACGAAAAIAATFNAPIAGALFSIEIVLGDLTVSSLSPIVISSVVATVISRHHLGDFPAFEVPAYQPFAAPELVVYAGLGLAAGLVAVGFIRMLYATGDLFESSPVAPALRPALGGLGVGVISLALPHVFGVGYETINAALWGEASGWLLVALVVAKALATSLTLGSGGSGGVFAPSLFMGATLGASWGHLANRILPDINAHPGSYALVGMGAMVAASTHAPITAILIIFELTNDYRTIPPLMLACVLGVLTATLIQRDSVYTAKLSRRGIRLAEGRDVNVLKALTVREVMIDPPEPVPAGLPLADLVPRLAAAPHAELPVVDRHGRWTGMVSLADVRAVLPDVDLLGSLAVAGDATAGRGAFLRPEDSLDLAMHVLGRTHREEVPVCTDATGRDLVGLVTRDAVIEAYNRQVFRLDLAGGFHSVVDAVREGRTVEVLGGIVLGEVEAPAGCTGRTLGELELRSRWGLEVVLIHRPDAPAAELDGRPGKLPTSATRLEAGDRLLVMGTPAAIDALRNGIAPRG